MNRLKALQVKSLPDGKFEDGAGLRLVRKNGSGKWVFRYSHLGKRREMGLGPQGSMTLAEARKTRDKWRSVLSSGQDPITVRNQQQADEKAARDKNDPAFEAVTEMVFESRKARLRGDGERGRWLSPVKIHVLPVIGRRKVSEIRASDICDALRPIWKTKHPTAEKAIQRVGIIMEGARRMGFDADTDAVPQARYMLGEVRHEVQHIAATPWQDLPELFDRLGDTTMSALCLRWLILTVVRSDAGRGARKDEIDGNVWTVPADRIKATEAAAKDFRVPLSGPALQIVEDTRHHPSGLLFPGHRDRPLTDVALSKRLNGLGEAGRIHGFRTSFRTWAQDTDACPWEVSETILGHTIGNKVERTYARSDLLDRRRVAMEHWAEFVTGQTAAKVVKIRG